MLGYVDAYAELFFFLRKGFKIGYTTGHFENK